MIIKIEQNEDKTFSAWRYVEAGEPGNMGTKAVPTDVIKKFHGTNKKDPMYFYEFSFRFKTKDEAVEVATNWIEDPKHQRAGQKAKLVM